MGWQIVIGGVGVLIALCVNMLTPKEHKISKKIIAAVIVGLVVIVAFATNRSDQSQADGQPRPTEALSPPSGDTSTVITAKPTVPTTVPTPAVTKTAQPKFFKVPLQEVLGYTSGAADSTVTVGNNIFRPSIDGQDTSLPVVGSTCSSITLTAGIDNDDPFGDSSRVVVQVEAGRPGGGLINVRKGKLATETFSLEPGNFQIAFLGAPVTQLNGYAQCTTPTGTSAAK